MKDINEINYLHIQNHLTEYSPKRLSLAVNELLLSYYTSERFVCSERMKEKIGFFLTKKITFTEPPKAFNLHEILHSSK